MSQHDMDIANGAGSAVRADINLALLALVSNSSGATAPATTFAYMFWADTTTGLLKIRNAANSAWITIGDTTKALLGLAGLSTAQQWSAAQRTTPLTDNDLSFDLSAANDFVCTPTAGGTLTFTNITAGCKGEVLLVNGSNYTIAKAGTVKASTSFLSTISATGRYRIAYSSLDGTNVDVSCTGALS